MDTTTADMGHEKSQQDPAAKSDAMLKEFMRGNTLPASYKEWKVCHRCSKREPAGEPFRQCGHCKAMGVEQFVLYCSRECQKGDWPEHKKICGDQQLTYDMKKDTGYVFLKPGSNKKGRLLLEWSHVYRRMLIWAVRQAFASPSMSYRKSRLIIQFNSVETRDEDGTWRDRIFPIIYLLGSFTRESEPGPLPEGSKRVKMTVTSHGIGERSPPLAEEQQSPILERERPAVAACELCLFDEHMVVLVPMVPCDQDAYFAPYNNITADPCPQWAFILHLLSLQAPRSSTILDGLLDGLLGHVAELEHRANRPSQKFSAPKLGFQPWYVYDHGINAWLIAMAPFLFRWKAKFHPEMDEKTWAKKMMTDTMSALKVTMQEMVSRSR